MHRIKTEMQDIGEFSMTWQIRECDFFGPEESEVCNGCIFQEECEAIREESE